MERELKQQVALDFGMQFANRRQRIETIMWNWQSFGARQ